MKASLLKYSGNKAACDLLQFTNLNFFKVISCWEEQFSIVKII